MCLEDSVKQLRKECLVWTSVKLVCLVWSIITVICYFSDDGRSDSRVCTVSGAPDKVNAAIQMIQRLLPDEVNLTKYSASINIKSQC